MTVIRTIYITQRELQHFKKIKREKEKKNQEKGQNPPLKQELRSKFLQTPIFLML